MRLAVALDGSTVGEGALATVAPWARESAAEVHLLTVLNPMRVHDTTRRDFVSSVPRSGAIPGEFAPVTTVARLRTIEDRTQAMARAREQAEDYLRAMAGRYLPGASVNVAVQWADHPAEAITDFAQAIGADLIVMGTHGRTGLSHALVGSVAEDTIRLAPVPVTVIRQGIADRTGARGETDDAEPTIQVGAAGKERLLSFLRRHEVPFVLRHHSPVLSAADLAASEHLPPDMVAKSIAFAADHDYALAVVPGSWQIDLNKLQTITGKDDVRLLTEAELTFVFPDCELGALHPFGNLYQLPVFVDSALAEARNLAFHAGTHTDAVYLTYADYVKAVKPVVADIKQTT
ncbi:MAG TPA: YbaK/EbsC family protein [Dehalococcoidia bacterium]|nr:YbaK/EbsC family protein [Dehalococcoidia bacterium]